MERSLAEETAPIEKALAALDGEKAGSAELMQQTENEAIHFAQAWRDGGIHRKQELQKALFPEGLQWWQKKRYSERGQGFTIEDLESVFDPLENFGVPITDVFEHLAATMAEATPLYELCASVLEA